MKVLSTALIAFLVSASAFSMHLTCVTEQPTTSVVSEIDGNDLVIHVVHHNGVGYMPLYSGIMTPNDIPTLTEKAKLFEKIGNHYILRWDLSNCERVDQDLMSCTRGKDTQINGVVVKPWSVYTQRIKTDYDTDTFEQIEVGFLMDIDGKTANFSMKYYRNECDQSEQKGHQVLKNFLAKKK